MKLALIEKFDDAPIDNMSREVTAKVNELLQAHPGHTFDTIEFGWTNDDFIRNKYTARIVLRPRNPRRLVIECRMFRLLGILATGRYKKQGVISIGGRHGTEQRLIRCGLLIRRLGKELEGLPQ